MKLSAILAPLIAAKVPHEVILQTVLAFEAEHGDAVEAGKEKARARWRKWKAANADKRLPTVANDSKQLTGADAPVEDKSLNTEIEPQKKDKTPVGDVVAFKAELSSFLSPDQLAALIKHRRTKRAQITAHAAKLFVRDAEAAGLSVADAADTCISRNWITVKADWLKPNARGSPQPAAPSQADVFAIFARNAPDEIQPEPQEDRSSLRPAIPHLSAVRSG